MLIKIKGTKTRDREKKLKRDTIESLNTLCEDREMVYNAFEIGTFPLKPTEGTGNQGITARVGKISDHSRLKMSTPKQMLQRLPIALSPINASNTPEDLLNKILEI